MRRGTRLSRRLAVLLAIGLGAYFVDAWAKQNAATFLGLLEFGLLVIWIGVDLNELFRGSLKAGPKQPLRIKAIDLPYYQALLAVYCIAIAGIALFRATNGEPAEFLESPFLVWIVVSPAVAAGFFFEYRAEGRWQET